MTTTTTMFFLKKNICFKTSSHIYLRASRRLVFDDVEVEFLQDEAWLLVVDVLHADDDLCWPGQRWTAAVHRQHRESVCIVGVSVDGDVDTEDSVLIDVELLAYVAGDRVDDTTVITFVQIIGRHLYIY